MLIDVDTRDLSVEESANGWKARKLDAFERGRRICRIDVQAGGVQPQGARASLAIHHERAVDAAARLTRVKRCELTDALWVEREGCADVFTRTNCVQHCMRIEQQIEAGAGDRDVRAGERRNTIEIRHSTRRSIGCQHQLGVDVFAADQKPAGDARLNAADLRAHVSGEDHPAVIRDRRAKITDANRFVEEFFSGRVSQDQWIADLAFEHARRGQLPRERLGAQEVEIAVQYPQIFVR